jgi:tetratricopeptide (TPR) repeat protein
MSRHSILLMVLLLLLLASCAAKKDHGFGVDADRMVTHRVTEGETWESISADFYGDGSYAEKLADYNGTTPDQPPPVGSGIKIPLREDHLDNINSSRKAYRLYNEGLDMAARGDFGNAVKRFQAALEEYPGFPEAAFNLAVTFQKLGLHDNAITVLKELTEKSTGKADYFYALGNSYFHRGDLEAAKENFSRALNVDHDHLKSVYSLAVVNQKQGDLGEARRLLERYLEKAPEGAWVDAARERLKSLEE